jgi:hypothetical protein
MEATPGIGPLLARALVEGRAAWPGVDVPEEAFARALSAAVTASGTCSRNNICNICWTSARLICFGISSSTTAGEVAFSSSIRCLVASRVRISSACLRTISVK